MKLIVGLGNPGADYERSRHNVGWMIADAFAKKFRIEIGKHEKDAMTGEGRVAGGSVKVAKPLTFMNNSGDVVRLLVNAYLDSTDDLMIVYDDIDLPLARLRIKPSGSAGAHKQVRSNPEARLSESLPPLRISGRGAGDARRPLPASVLHRFYLPAS